MVTLSATSILAATATTTTTATAARRIGEGVNISEKTLTHL